MDVITLKREIENCLRGFMVHNQGCSADIISMSPSFMRLPSLGPAKDVLPRQLIYEPRGSLIASVLLFLLILGLIPLSMIRYFIFRFTRSAVYSAITTRGREQLASRRGRVRFLATGWHH